MIEGNISIDEFRNSAGTSPGPSDWLLIDQDRINLFAEILTLYVIGDQL